MFVVFFLSGMAGLVYQVAWSRLLTLVIGVSTFAITTVICTFMLGLALGAWLAGQRIERLRDPLLVYAVIEGLIGVYAALTPWIFDAMQPLYAWVFPRFDRLGLNVVRVALSTAALLLPTTLMGATLPLLSRAVSRGRTEGVRGAGLLYAVNTLGAVAGCALAGFVLLGTLGINGALFTAACINVGIAVAIVFGRGRGSATVPALSVPPAAVAASDHAPTAAPGSTLVLVVFFLSGIAALGYEVLWTRALLVYLKASTYAFCVMLCVYLLGVALGSAAATPLAARTRRPLRALAVCQLGVALTVVAGMLAFPQLDALRRAVMGPSVRSFGLAVALMIGQAACVLLLPTLFMGAMFAFGVAAYQEGTGGIGRRVGYVYAANTAGNIVGAIFVGFVLISVLGVRHSMVGLVGLNLLLAAALVAHERRRAGAVFGLMAAAIAAAALVHVGVPRHLFYDSITRPPNRIVYYREGASDTVAVVESAKDGGRALIYSDGRGAAGTGTLPWNLYFGHLLMLLHQEPRDVLHICYGSGNSVMSLTRYDTDRIDVVELSPHVRETSRYFWTNENVLESDRVNLVIEDGRNFALGTDRTYDVISLEPPNIYTAGVVNLYSEEFYRLCRRRLKPGGVMMQWLPTIQLATADRGMLIRAFADAFPWVSVWQQLNTTSLLLVGSDRPIRVDVDELDRRLRATPAMRRDLEAMGLENAYGFLSYYLLGDASTRKLVEAYRPVRDDKTVVDYSIPRFVGSGFGFSIFTYMIGDEQRNPNRVLAERMKEYAAWGDPASTIVPDPCQAKRLDLAIRRRMSGQSGDAAAGAVIAGCPAGGTP